MAERLHRIDPRGCGCTDCLIGYSKPLESASREEVMALIHGLYQNATGIDLDEVKDAGWRAQVDGMLAEMQKYGASKYL